MNMLRLIKFASRFMLEQMYTTCIPLRISCIKLIIPTFYQAQAAKYFEVQATKYDKLSLWVQCPVQSVAIFKLFFVDAINWTFLYLFLLPSLE